jgi:hypothetical protein
MKQLRSALNIPQSNTPEPQTTTDAVIDTVFKIRHDIIDAIIKRNRF